MLIGISPYNGFNLIVMGTIAEKKLNVKKKERAFVIFLWVRKIGFEIIQAAFQPPVGIL